MLAELQRAIGTFTVRAQGLQAWTEMIKRRFTMEFMGLQEIEARKQACAIIIAEQGVGGRR